MAVGTIGGGWTLAESRDKDRDSAQADPVALGSEIFHREWMPEDPRGHGGDGLGPAFNDSSCIACHNSGGSGGAGPVGKNIDILSASRAPQQLHQGGKPVEVSLEPLFALHAGFRAGGKTVVLHKFGTDPGYDAFRSKLVGTAEAAANQVVANLNPTGNNVAFTPITGRLQGMVTFDGMVTATNTPSFTSAASPDLRIDSSLVRLNEVRAAVLANRSGMVGTLDVGGFTVSRSQRNPTPLFGLGLVDAIPDSVIDTMASKQATESPGTAGRAARVPGGRIGRLGWKGQTANSADFVLNACAVEIGLEVPGHSQAITPQAPRYKGPGLDLTQGDCDALVAYVRSLPRPVERVATSSVEAKFLGAGKATFAKVGCVGCHAPKLGEVDGLYSDLLLHDMGDDTADNGSYDGGNGDPSDDPLIPPDQVVDNAKGAQQGPGQAARGAGKKEWRTPPLWGFRDSAPYLHDGRAQTLEQAVALHGGQGSASAQAFFKLSANERLQLEGFLKSLVAPSPVDYRREIARAGD